MPNQILIDELQPLLAHLRALDLTDAQAARAALDTQFPPDSDLFSNVRALAIAALKEGTLCNREAGDSRFSRVAKPELGGGFSIDAVLLWGEGAWHRHTNGEVNMMFALEGEPTFCGVGPGWAVYPPGSAHVPAVAGGKMLILYFLPGGAVEWKQ